MKPASVRARNAFVLMIALLILLVGAVIGWARNFLLGATPWTALFDSGHAAVVLLVLVALLVVAARLLTGRPGLPVRWLPVVHHRWLLAGSLAGLLLVAAGNALFSSSRAAPALSVLTGLAGALILLHSAYGRTELDIPAILLALGWATSGLIAVSTLRALVEPNPRHIDVYRLKMPLDASYVPAARLATAILLAIFIAGPLLGAALPGVARRVRGLLSGWPLWDFCLSPAAALLVQIGVWLAGSSQALRLLNWLVLIVMLPGTALLAFWVPGGDAPPTIDVTDKGARRALIGLLVVYALVSVPVAISWIDQTSADVFSYLQMARNLAAGQPAVRGMWAPLAAWVFVPGFWLGIDPLIVQRVLVAVLGLAFIGGMFGLARHFELPPAFRWALAAAGTIFVLRFAYWPPGGDFISAVLLLMYFSLITGEGWREHPVRVGLLAGGIGATAYYARSFNLPFILVHLVLTLVVFALHRRSDLRPLLISAGLAALVLVGSAAPWVSALRARYGRLTFSVSSTYNSGYVQNNYHVFCYYDRLCDQPPDVLFPWEDPDPALYEPLAESPLHSLENAAEQVELVFVNMKLWSSNLTHNLGLLTLLGLAGSLLVLLAEWDRERQRRNLLWMLLTMALYNGGYWLYIAGEFRYYYPLVPFLFIGVFLPVARLAARWRIPRRLAPALGSALILVPLISQGARTTRYMSQPRLFTARDRCLETDGDRLKADLVEPIAGSGFTINEIAYATQLRAYGALTADLDADAIHRQLIKYGVGSFIVSSNREHLIDTLVSEYGYQVTPASFCGRSLVILTVP